MAYYFYPPEAGGGAQEIVKYATFAAFAPPSTAGNGALALAIDTGILYESNGTTWRIIAGPGTALSIGTFDSGTASANGAHIDSNALIMQSASATNPGLVNISTQTFAGVKTFSSAPNLSSLTASQALVLDASKNVTTVPYVSTATASTIAARDANANCYANNWVNNTAFITSAAGQTNLTPASARVEVLTGTQNQTFRLPNANSFPSIGAIFEFNNNSTGILTVNDQGGGLISNVPAGGYARVILTDNSTSAGVWDYHFLIPANSTWGTAGINVSGSAVATSTVQGTRLISTVATGTAPLTVSSTTQVANLNAATAGNFTGSLSGDVTGTQSATVLSATTNATLTTLSALVSVGTITTGTWNATAVAINHGGTGQTTAAAAFSALSPITTTGDLIYSSSGTTNSRLAIGSTGNVLTVSGGVPTWAPPATSGTVTSVALSVPATSIFGVTGSPVTSSGTLELTTTGTSGGIPYFSSTTQLASSALLTASQLIIGGGAAAAPVTLAAGSQFNVLVMGATTPGYGQVNLASTAAVTGTLPVGNGGTGQTSVTYAPGTTAGFIATSGVLGFTNGSSGAAGFLGEVLTTSATGATLPTSTTWGDAGSLALTAGDWDLTHQVYFIASGTTFTNPAIGISTTSGNSQTGLVNGDNRMSTGNPQGGGDTAIAISQYVVRISGTTTYFAKLAVGFSGGTPTYSYRFNARRVR